MEEFSKKRRVGGEEKKPSVSQNLRARKNQAPSERALSVLIPYTGGAGVSI